MYVCMYVCMFFVVFLYFWALLGLKLDEIDAANSFLMLPKAPNGSKWPGKTDSKPIKMRRQPIFFCMFWALRGPCGVSGVCCQWCHESNMKLPFKII